MLRLVFALLSCGGEAHAGSHTEQHAFSHGLEYRRAQRTATTFFERSETEHPPFAARLAFARPPRTRRRSKRRSRKR
ncbi:hypothetical protein ACWEKR_19740, partial [Nocardia sp. NPDC004573]